MAPGPHPNIQQGTHRKTPQGPETARPAPRTARSPRDLTGTSAVVLRRRPPNLKETRQSKPLSPRPQDPARPHDEAPHRTPRRGPDSSLRQQQPAGRQLPVERFMIAVVKHVQDSWGKNILIQRKIIHIQYAVLRDMLAVQTASYFKISYRENSWAESLWVRD